MSARVENPRLLTWQEMVIAKFPPFRSDWEPAQQRAWFAAFLTLLEMARNSHA